MSNRVIPILRLAVLCEQLDLDKYGRPFFCVPVHTIRFPEGVSRNYEPPTLHVYVQLQEALGSFHLGVVMRRERGTIDLYRSPTEQVEFDGENFQPVPQEFNLELRSLVVPEPGHYELWVQANHVNLHDPNQQPGWPFPPMKLTVFGPDGTEGGVV